MRSIRVALELTVDEASEAPEDPEAVAEAVAAKVEVLPYITSADVLRGSEINLGLVSVPDLPEQQREKASVMDVLREYGADQADSEGVPTRVVVDDADASEAAVLRLLQRLEAGGEVYQPRPDYWRIP